MKVDEIISIAEKNNLNLIVECVEDNHFGLICWFNVGEFDKINWSVKEGSKSKLEKMLNEKADGIMKLFPKFKCVLIEFFDHTHGSGEDNEAYYFEFIKPERI